MSVSLCECMQDPPLPSLHLTQNTPVLFVQTSMIQKQLQ